MMFHAPYEVKKGDMIEVEAQGIVVKGKVYDANWFNGADGGYYIEIIDANVPGGYSYWKERQDGGKIVSINGKKI